MKRIGLIFEMDHKSGGGHFWRCFNLANQLNNKNRKFFFISNKLKISFTKILKKKKIQVWFRKIN